MDSNRILISLGSNSLEIGMVVAWTLSSNPSDNYLECNGQGVDKNKYPKLYQLMHNVPDYRGVFLRGLGGNSSDLGILQNDAIRNITGSFMVAGNGNDHGLGQPQSGAFYQTWRASGSEWGNNGTPYYMTYFDASRVVPAAEENRPVNKSVRYFMKAK
ncbi:phage tail protein [Megamonas funiformis]|uniref:phage tail protein n=1 Tax=Megamonas funiformis TaxID=437897 RepID=UPI003F9CD337